MKKMSKVVFAIIIGLCVSTQAQTGSSTSSSSVSVPQIQFVAPIESTNGVMNPLDIARAFALKTPYTYHGYMECNMLISNVWQSRYMEWDMDSQFAITSLTVNGDQIPLPEPIYGLPMGDAGVANSAYINVYAMTKTGDYAGSGSLQKNVVLNGDSLVVTLTLASITVPLPINVGSNGIAQLTINDFPYGYGWWTDNGKLYVSLPPVGGSYSYIVRDGNGNVIGSGTIEPFHTAITPSDAYVGVNLLGNVVGAEFPQPDGYDSWVGIPDVGFDCSITTASGVVLGKVIFADAGSGGLEVILSGDYWIYIQSATANNGDMPFLTLNDNSSPGYETRVNTTGMGVGKLVITIIPKTTGSVVKTWVNLHRLYGPVGKGGEG